MQKLFKSVIPLLVVVLCTSFVLLADQVYICKGPSSKVYHKSDRCKGLSRCSTEVSKVTIEEAKKLGRRACKIEY
jgi:hypothetical protein